VTRAGLPSLNSGGAAGLDSAVFYVPAAVPPYLTIDYNVNVISATCTRMDGWMVRV